MNHIYSLILDSFEGVCPSLMKKVPSKGVIGYVYIEQFSF
jgi:hypothetical protein